jgi:hypothetical protein
MATFPCEGHALDIYHKDTKTPEEFGEVINQKLDVLFGESARGLNIEATMYNPRTNWWVYVQVLYEYGIQGNQVLSTAKANIQTFRLNIYQNFGDTATLEEKGIEVET